MAETLSKDLAGMSALALTGFDPGVLTKSDPRILSKVGWMIGNDGRKYLPKQSTSIKNKSFEVQSSELLIATI